MTDELNSEREIHRRNPPLTEERYEIRSAELTSWLKRHGVLIVVCAVLGAVAVSIYTARSVTDTFRASAILAIIPPKESSDLLPSTLTIQGFQELLESDAVVAATEARLVEAGDLSEGDHLSPDQLTSRIFVSQRREDTLLAPMIRLEARSPSAERAQAIVSTWASVFLKNAHDLMFGTISTTSQFVQTQYPEVRDRLGEIEKEHARTADELDRRRADAATRWDRELSEARSEAARQTALYDAETDRLIAAFRAEHQLASRQGELDSLRGVLKDHQKERAQLGARLASLESEVHQLDNQVAEIAPVMSLARSIDADVLAAALAGRDKGAGSLDALKDLKLSTEVQNPVFNQLAAEAARRTTDLGVLRPREEQLAGQIESETARVGRLEQGLAEDEAALTKLRAERSAGATALNEKRKVIEQSLATERDTELALIDRERERRLAPLERQIEQEHGLFDQLSAKYNDTLLAKGEEQIDVIRLAAPAVLPRAPLPRGQGGGAALGLFLGCVAGLVLAAVRDRWFTSGA